VVRAGVSSPQGRTAGAQSRHAACLDPQPREFRGSTRPSQPLFWTPAQMGAHACPGRLRSALLKPLAPGLHAASGTVPPTGHLQTADTAGPWRAGGASQKFNLRRSRPWFARPAEIQARQRPHSRINGAALPPTYPRRTPPQVPSHVSRTRPEARSPFGRCRSGWRTRSARVS
jgi:hypothetical protein